MLYEIIVGTNKFLSEPVATNSYTTETELPTLTICQRSYELRIADLYGLDYRDYLDDGKFVPDNFTSDKSLDDIFQESINEAYFLLDVTGNVLVKLKLNNQYFNFDHQLSQSTVKSSRRMEPIGESTMVMLM